MSVARITTQRPYMYEVHSGAQRIINRCHGRLRGPRRQFCSESLIRCTQAHTQIHNHVEKPAASCIVVLYGGACRFCVRMTLPHNHTKVKVIQLGLHAFTLINIKQFMTFAQKVTGDYETTHSRHQLNQLLAPKL